MLTGLVAVAALLLVRTPVPVRRSGFYALHGHRVFRAGRQAVTGIDVEYEGRRFAARRAADGWRIDGAPASAGTADALDGLLDTLLSLRAVDVFRSREAHTFGLDAPRGHITLVTGRGPRRLAIGAFNGGGTAFYARCGRDPRVLLVGGLVLSELQRVFYTRDLPPRGATESSCGPAAAMATASSAPSRGSPACSASPSGGHPAEQAEPLVNALAGRGGGRPPAAQVLRSWVWPVAESPRQLPGRREAPGLTPRRARAGTRGRRA